LDIDEVIIGIKYKYADLNVTKGKYSTTLFKKAKVKDANKINKAMFYNQITIIVNNRGNHVNVKLFGNGSLHMTGCKSENDGEEVAKLLYTKLDAVRNKTDTLLLTKDVHGVLCDKDKLVYSATHHQVMGFVKETGIYVINKKEYVVDPKTEMLIYRKIETQRTRHIIDMDGREVGRCKIELLKNKNKFYKKNSNIYFDYINSLIYYNNDTVIGRLAYDIEPQAKSVCDTPEIMEIPYRCCPFVNRDYMLDAIKLEVDVNCINVYFNIGFKLNRIKLYERLLSFNYICKFKPESYSGIKLIFKIPVASMVDSNGICTCSSKCTCRNITFLIFQSGNVIATGFRKENEINDICAHFTDLCNDLASVIRSKIE
jgi:TATA-box binding protein (TBP) (component of TFIID and TFIIIB)